MYLLSLLCLILVSSSALASTSYGDSYRTADRISTSNSNYGGNSAPLLDNTKTVLTNSGYSGSQMAPSSFDTKPVNYASMSGSTFDPSQQQSAYGSQSNTLQQQRDQGRMQTSGFQSTFMQSPSFDQTEPVRQPPPPPSDADILCRGQQPDTIIALKDPHRYIVCTANGKGDLLPCPSGLYYVAEARRCERRLTVTDPCQKQPCLHGGQCTAKDASTFECRCPQGLSGTTCELDSRVCEQKQPCGAENRCQSFRVDASLSYICIINGGRVYGTSASQIFPNPCGSQDGPQALATGNEGFIVCDGQQMFVESCPGGTVWDDKNKGCVWPDMAWISTSQQDQARPVQQSYGSSQQQLPSAQMDRPVASTSYSSSAVRPSPVQPLQDTRPISTGYSYSAVPRQEDRPVSSTSYSQSAPVVQLREERPVSTLTSSYSQNAPIFQRQEDRPASTLTSNYGQSVSMRQEDRAPVASTYEGAYQQPLSVVRDAAPLLPSQSSSYNQQPIRPTNQFDNTPRKSSY